MGTALKKLTQTHFESYQDHGYITPVRAFSAEKAAEYRVKDSNIKAD